MVQALRNRLYPIKRAVVRSVSSVFDAKLAPRSDNPYATHLPILIGLSLMLPIRRVAEFGCGYYSTTTFLNRDVFAHLERLDAYENDPVWIEEIRCRAGNDERLSLNRVMGPMAAAVSESPIRGYDLIFVDDSTAAEERAATIREVVKRCDRSTIVLIHDYEVGLYRAAAGAFKRRYRFTCFTPNTGVLWNAAAIDKRQLRRLDAVIREAARDAGPADVEVWLRQVRARLFTG